jgi:NAD(P)-dependent dehydrogenase (short-subunit alcohol dehydrogenase family)
LNVAAAELAGKVAIVTGASRGLGYAIAHKFADAGAQLVMTGLNKERGEAAAVRLGKEGFVQADQGSAADWDRVVDTALSRFGRIDILVANAGITHGTPTADMSLEEFRNLNRVNLKGCFLGVKACVAAMRRHGQGGSILLMSSIVGKVGIPGLIHYSAAKGGLRLMAKAAALEFGPEKIRVNSLHPGMVRTDMTAPFPEAQMAARIPLGKFGEPDDVANAALFLAGPRGQFITGTELVIDGGWLVQ